MGHYDCRDCGAYGGISKEYCETCKKEDREMTSKPMSDVLVLLDRMRYHINESGCHYTNDEDCAVLEAALTSEPVAGPLEEGEREIDLSGLMLGTHVIVPIEPTEEMIESGINAGEYYQDVWDAMLSAAPPHTETERG